MGVSLRAYARHRGVSDMAVRKAIKAGRLSVEADGTVDIAKADLEWARNTDVAQQRKPVPSSAQKAVPKAALDAVNDTLHESGTPVGGSTFIQARAANEVLKAQTNRIRLQQLKNELVDRAKAITLIFKLARTERDAWLNWPARVSSQMAAELNIDAHTMHVILENHVRQHLSELADIKPKLD